jgi:heme/copper-type cytochrome/quinol oxidase subunit 2
MTLQNTPTTTGQKAIPGNAAWLWLSIAAALLAIAGSVIGLSVPSIYARLTPAFLPQAIAQDIANLALASPAILILAVLGLQGSLRAYLLWLGVLIFTVYNYVIYTFSVPFGLLFPLWVVVLGMCIYALIGGVASADHRAIQASYTSRRAVVVIAWVLIVVAILFGLLWLSEDVPALLKGTSPQSVVDMALPTNPVHILDLAFFLPAVIASGVLLLQRKPLGYTLAPAFIVFLILTGVPILITPAVQTLRGETAAWGVVVPIGALTLLLLGLLVWLLSTIRAREQTG